MQTELADFIKDTPEGREAEAILRKCVHCGFCTATCPTYQLLGDELDGPRGRIYLIKQMLEGHAVTAKTQLHLDRCSTCRSCETTCPSGAQVREAGRHRPRNRRRKGRPAPRPAHQARHVALGADQRPAVRLCGRHRPPAARPAARARLKRSLQPRVAPGLWPQLRHLRKMLVLKGCVQPVLLPRIDAAAARVLDRLGVDLVSVPESGCCGAARPPHGRHDAAVTAMKRNIDAWWPHIEQGVEAIVVTASGCGVMVKDYGHLLRLDPLYAARAARVSELAKDVSEVITAEWGTHHPAAARQRAGSRGHGADGVSLALHAAARPQAQGRRRADPARPGIFPRAGGRRASVLRVRGHLLDPAALKPPQRLKADKLATLQAGGPAVIASANVGRMTHLAIRN